MKEAKLSKRVTEKRNSNTEQQKANWRKQSKTKTRDI